MNKIVNFSFLTIAHNALILTSGPIYITTIGLVFWFCFVRQVLSVYLLIICKKHG